MTSQEKKKFNAPHKKKIAKKNTKEILEKAMDEKEAEKLSKVIDESSEVHEAFKNPNKKTLEKLSYYLKSVVNNDYKGRSVFSLYKYYRWNS